MKDRTAREWLEALAGLVLMLTSIWADVGGIVRGVWLLTGWFLIFHSNLGPYRRRTGPPG